MTCGSGFKYHGTGFAASKANWKTRREPSKIVKAHDVIGMRMSEDHCIDSADIFAQCLRPKIGSRVNDPRTFRRFDVN